MVKDIGEGFGDRLRDDIGEGRWLTYTELAEIRGIGRESAVKLVQREGWRKASGNSPDRTVRVFVPEEWLRPAKGGHVGEGIPEGFGELSRLLSGLEDTVTFVRERAEVAEARADAADADRRVAEARADAERARADRADNDRRTAEARAEQAEGRLFAERQRADELRVRLETVQAEAGEARAVADQARAEAEEARQAAEARVASVEGEASGKVAQAEAAAARAREVAQEAVQAAETLQVAIDELKAGQAMMQDMHASELAVAQHDAQAGQQAAAELRRVEEARRATGRWARLRAAWRGQ
jgi:chromosome segregation ATPase